MARLPRGTRWHRRSVQQRWRAPPDSRSSRCGEQLTVPTGDASWESSSRPGRQLKLAFYGCVTTPTSERGKRQGREASHRVPYSINPERRWPCRSDDNMCRGIGLNPGLSIVSCYVVTGSRLLDRQEGRRIDGWTVHCRSGKRRSTGDVRACGGRFGGWVLQHGDGLAGGVSGVLASEAEAQVTTRPRHGVQAVQVQQLAEHVAARGHAVRGGRGRQPDGSDGGQQCVVVPYRPPVVDISEIESGGLEFGTEVSEMRGRARRVVQLSGLVDRPHVGDRDVLFPQLRFIFLEFTDVDVGGDDGDRSVRADPSLQ